MLDQKGVRCAYPLRYLLLPHLCADRADTVRRAPIPWVNHVIKARTRKLTRTELSKAIGEKPAFPVRTCTPEERVVRDAAIRERAKPTSSEDWKVAALARALAFYA